MFKVALYCADTSLKNGDTKECNAEIIRFRIDGDGKREVLYIQPVTAEYEHYHGDLEEHGTYH